MTAGRTLALASLVVVAAVLALAFMAIGSPSAQRDLRLDERRLDDIADLRTEVLVFWKREKALPTDLATLAASPGATVPTRDPVTGAPYEYAVVAPDRFRLCAVFATDTSERAGRSRGYQRDHGRGRHCFEHRVDDFDADD